MQRTRLLTVSLSVAKTQKLQFQRSMATVSPITYPSRSHKIVVVGAGSAGLSISHQLLRQGKFSPHEIAIIDPSRYHNYQPGWTLVGGGLKTKQELRKPLDSLIDPKLKFYNSGVTGFDPEDNEVMLGSGEKVGYEQLVLVPGIKVDYGSVGGLQELLDEPDSPVSSIYDYRYCDKVWTEIQKFKGGNALFTQPAGIIKCAGAPQKIMWLALDYWKKAGLYNPSSPTSSPISITFATALPTMFGVPKYGAVLEALRVQRGVEGLFSHDLTSITKNTATFSTPNPNPTSTSPAQAQVTKNFDFLHVAPKNRPYSFISDSPLANEAGYVDVNPGTLQHVKYGNVWSAGDASSLPTSKTVAAITSQAPVLVHNLLTTLTSSTSTSPPTTNDKKTDAIYDGYTSCPLLTSYGKVLLAEFKYNGVPKETFNKWLGIDQSKPNRAFYHLKKDFFPWVYNKFMVNGRWAGPNGFVR